YPANTASGLHVGMQIRNTLAVIEDEARLGIPPEQIVLHFQNTFQAYQEERAIRAMPMLREAGVGAFAGRSTEDGLVGAFAVVGGLVVVALAVRWLFLLGRAVQVERARELFRLQHERFEEMLLAAASATGKPRGLRWIGCEISGDADLVRDTATR